MGHAQPPRPVKITPFPNGEIGVVWEDGVESYYGGYELRCACPCAACVEEMTGRRVLRKELVPRDVHPVQISPVGNYAVGIRWSDGHDTGIYSFETLRRLAE